MTGHAEGESSGAHGVAFSPDGKSLAADTADGQVELWSVADGKSILTFPGGSVTALAFSPDGKSLAIGASDNHVLMLDVPSGKAVTEYLKIDDKEHAGIHGVVFSPDGKHVAVATDGGDVKVFDVADRTK